jgi:imidazolonepropionase
MQYADFIVHNIGELVTLDGPNRPRIREEMQELGIIHDGAVAMVQGKIVAVGKSSEIHTEWQAKETLDARKSLVTPGFVDPHTHPVFAATREAEFEMRIRGATYQEIAKAGGGIRESARRLQKIPKEVLKEQVRSRLDRFLCLGTTTIEAKSGYGLSTDAEIKSLEILCELRKEHSIGIVPTFMGAHEVPDEYQHHREGYISLLIQEMIPEVTRRKLAKYCDIFCERGVFSIEESRRVLEAARKEGLSLKLHADELSPLGGAELAAALHATSADHLVFISDQGIEDMKNRGVVAVLLPATTFFLASSPYAPARKMISCGVPVALSTDFNPGSAMTQSMPIVLTLATLYLRMLPSEALVASTINAAFAIGMADRVGSISVGKEADLLLWEASSYRYLPYHFGDNLLWAVIKSGKIVSRSPSCLSKSGGSL